MSAARPPPCGRPVSLHVERLVLDCPGMGRVEAARFERAMRAELARLVETSPAVLAAPGGAVPGKAARPVSIDSPVRPAELGKQVARSVFNALSGAS